MFSPISHAQERELRTWHEPYTLSWRQDLNFAARSTPDCSVPSLLSAVVCQHFIQLNHGSARTSAERRDYIAVGCHRTEGQTAFCSGTKSAAMRTPGRTSSPAGRPLRGQLAADFGSGAVPPPRTTLLRISVLVRQWFDRASWLTAGGGGLPSLSTLESPPRCGNCERDRAGCHCRNSYGSQDPPR
jgi:hypothetical protein